MIIHPALGRLLPLALLALATLITATASADEKQAKPKTDEEIRQSLLELNDITGMDPLRGKLKELLRDKVGAKKWLPIAHKMSKEKPQPFNRNVTFLLAMAAENVRDVDSSSHFYRLYIAQSLRLTSDRGIAQGYLGLIQMYLDNRKYAESEKACREVLGIEGEEEGDLEDIKPTVMRNLVLAIARQGNHDRALKIAEDLIKADPKNWLHLALKGRVLREADRLEDSAKVYLDVIEKAKKETRLKDAVKEEYIEEYRYLLSGIYTDLEQIDKAAEQLKTLLAKDPNNATYNNDLGFIWADRGMNLPEAEKMIRKAIEEDRKQRKSSPLYDAEKDRDNPAYLDSLGWVLFKQGKAKEAKPHLLEALKQRAGRHTEIYDHLGDIHLALGEKTEAVAVWKKAVEVATTSKRDIKRKAEVQKKLKKMEEK